MITSCATYRFQGSSLKPRAHPCRRADRLTPYLKTCKACQWRGAPGTACASTSANSTALAGWLITCVTRPKPQCSYGRVGEAPASQVARDQPCPIGYVPRHMHFAPAGTWIYGVTVALREGCYPHLRSRDAARTSSDRHECQQPPRRGCALPTIGSGPRSNCSPKL